MAQQFLNSSLKVLRSRPLWGIAAIIIAAAAVLLTGCPPAPPAPRPPTPISIPEVRWKVYSARRQMSYMKLDLPVMIAGTAITIGKPVMMVPADQAGAHEGSLLNRVAAQTAPSAGPTTSPASAPDGDVEHPLVAMPASWGNAGGITVYSTHVVRGAAEGPLVDQLAGQPRYAVDAGCYLVALAARDVTEATQSAKGAATQPAGMPGTVYQVKDPFPVYLKVTVPPGVDTGEYRFPIRIAMPGRAAEDAMISVEVADIAMPTDPRVLALATTTVAELSRVYPDSFGSISANYLDRNDPDDKAAVEQLDALVRAARAEGVALFVEDIGPSLHVDELGQVTMDWDAYDRLVQPYMDGTAFDDRIPLPVWLAPVPPRRIRDSSTQLWQYIDACAKHFAAKGWVASPAFMHPALAAGGGAERPGGEFLLDATKPGDNTALLAQVSEMVRLHMPRDMLVVGTPDATAEGVPQGQLWCINDDDPRLPPAGTLASEYSVRAWPWMCIARGNTAGGSPTGVKGFVWRDAVAAAEELTPQQHSRPLLVVQKGAQGGRTVISPSLRMTYLSAGMNDAALVGLLQKRADPTLNGGAGGGMISEILAGMVGRTGTRNNPVASDPSDIPLAAPGFLFSAWSNDRATWNQVTPTLERLILAADPGSRASIRTDDPLYLAARMWLSQTRRPVARVAGYTFSMRPGRDSDILDIRLHLFAENPVDAPADIDLRFADLPGDFDLPPIPGADVQIRRRLAALAPTAAADITMPLAGHVESLLQAPGINTLELTEHHAGALLRLPVQLPIYRIHGTENPPKADGNPDDWPALRDDPQTRVFGQMKVATHYLSRPDLLAASLRQDDQPALVRWTYDKDYLYMLARCDQDSISDERNTDWPLQDAGAGKEGAVRWWGSDGLQVELAAMPPTQRAAAATAPAGPDVYDRVVKIAFKPAGVALIQTGMIEHDAKTGAASISWHDGPPAPSGSSLSLKYGITLPRQEGHPVAYIVEAAIPRAWIDGPPIDNVKSPAWRVNVLRHRAGDLSCTSWAGPIVHDNDVGMMGALLGE